MATKTLERTAPDISCDHCVKTITQALNALTGVGAVEVDIDTKRVRAAFDPDLVDEQRIEAALEEEGYPVA